MGVNFSNPIVAMSNEIEFLLYILTDETIGT